MHKFIFPLSLFCIVLSSNSVAQASTLDPPQNQLIFELDESFDSVVTFTDFSVEKHFEFVNVTSDVSIILTSENEAPFFVLSNLCTNYLPLAHGVELYRCNNSNTSTTLAHKFSNLIDFNYRC